MVQNATGIVHEFLKSLVAAGAKNVHIVGLGVGAHIGGAASKDLSPKVDRVTGEAPKRCLRVYLLE